MRARACDDVVSDWSRVTAHAAEEDDITDEDLCIVDFCRDAVCVVASLRRLLW
jgi:hypothetical protein